MKERPPDTREKILKRLGGWNEPAFSREVEALLNGDLFDQCPLKALGYRLVEFNELGSRIIGPDDKCICSVGVGCLKHDGIRCTLEQLKKLDDEATRRRAWQSGD